MFMPGGAKAQEEMTGCDAYWEVLISCSPPVWLFLLLCVGELYSAEKYIVLAQTKGFSYFTMVKCLSVC